MGIWFILQALGCGLGLVLGIHFIVDRKVKRVLSECQKLQIAQNELLDYMIQLRAVSERIAKKTDELFSEDVVFGNTTNEEGYAPGVYDPEDQLYPWEMPHHPVTKKGQ